MKIEKVKISKIKPNPDNPRVIQDADFDRLVKSIEDFPEMLEIRPIVVDNEGMVLGGNQRLKACKKAGLKEVFIIRASELTEEQREKFIIRDNGSWGAWDFDLLSDWDPEELELSGVELPELEVEIPEAKEVEPPQVRETDIVIGDLFEIGEHRLLCGDSTDSDAVERLMGGEKADMVFTDPPYGMSAVSKSGVLKEKYSNDIIGDNNTNTAKDAFNLIHSLFPNSLHIWWGANYYSSCLPDSECWIVWDKNNGQSDQTDCELAWSNARSVVRQYTKASEKINRVHPTQKPVDLVDWCINRFAIDSNLIADFFLGSGSTMVAAHQLQRKCYGMELDPVYCDVIIRRMLKTDPTLTIKRNGIEETDKWTTENQ